MIDDDDVDFAILASPTRGWAALVGLVLVIVLAVLAYENTEECSTRHCPDGQRPKLMKHECLCVTEAVP